MVGGRLGTPLDGRDGAVAREQVRAACCEEDHGGDALPQTIRLTRGQYKRMVFPMVNAGAAHVRPDEDLTTRARIRDAAMVEFSEKGLRGATMRGIASAAGVSLGLVQHHFGTKEGLRAACDERVLELVRFKIRALEEGVLGEPQVLSKLLSMAPLVQRYVARALVDGSPRMAGLVDEVMAKTEEFLTSRWPDRFAAGTRRTRDAGAVMTAINTSTMVLQANLAGRMDVEPWSETAIRRIGIGMFDIFEAIADMVDSDMWRDLRAAVDVYPDNSEETR